MNEAQFKAAVNTHVRLLSGHQVYVWGIADKCTAGVPDTWYDYHESIWIEYKFGPKSYGVTDLQLRWLVDRHNNGRNVAVVHGFTDHIKIFRVENEKLTLTHTVTTKRELAQWILTEVKCPCTPTPTKRRSS